MILNLHLLSYTDYDCNYDYYFYCYKKQLPSNFKFAKTTARGQSKPTNFAQWHWEANKRFRVKCFLAAATLKIHEFGLLFLREATEQTNSAATKIFWARVTAAELNFKFAVSIENAEFSSDPKVPILRR